MKSALSRAKNAQKRPEKQRNHHGLVVRRSTMGKLILGLLAALSNHRLEKVFTGSRASKFSGAVFPKETSNQVARRSGKNFSRTQIHHEADYSARCGKLVSALNKRGKSAIFPQSESAEFSQPSAGSLRGPSPPRPCPLGYRRQYPKTKAPN